MTNTNTNTNWVNPTNYWANTNWANPFSTLTGNNTLPTNWANNPFNSNPLTTGLTTLVNNTPATPFVNAYETTDTYFLELSTPGYEKESFEISYSNNTLTVRANVENSNKNNYSYREFNYASFTREFTLPNNVDTNETRAKYDNGILTILLPKTTNNNSNYRTVKVG
jgi:HSP20 family protein